MNDESVLAVLDWQIREAQARKSKSVTGAAALKADVARLQEARDYLTARPAAEQHGTRAAGGGR